MKKNTSKKTNIENENEAVRINKFISHNTKYSRREADKLIADGRVKIGHKPITDPATFVAQEDNIFIDGNFIKRKSEDQYTVIVYNKPKGELVTKSDPLGRKTIYDTLPSKYKHYIPIGRLDFASEGLILLTDSPKIASILMHSELERMYKVKIKGNINNAITSAMNSGIEIKYSTKGAHAKSTIENMTFAPFVRYTILKDAPTYSKLKVVIAEGQNRELRRFFAHFERDVTDLKRLEYGGVSLNNLPEGKCRFLSKDEYKSLHTYLKEIDSSI